VGKLIELEANLLGFDSAAGITIRGRCGDKAEKPTQKTRRIKRKAFWN
jgi:hypothetical protein